MGATSRAQPDVRFHFDLQQTLVVVLIRRTASATTTTTRLKRLKKHHLHPFTLVITLVVLFVTGLGLTKTLFKWQIARNSNSI